jgi:double-stranded uracil-DNA glycosylase
MADLWVRAISEDAGLRREAFVAAEGLPLWLARLHRSLPVGAAVSIQLDGEVPVPREQLLEGAGFALSGSGSTRRDLTLPDTVGGGMRLLVVGLNPSPYAAEVGVGFARPGNRFWPAVLEAGLASVDRDPDHALAHHRLGMTDLVKRPSRRADELTRAEYRRGLARVSRLVGWLAPRAVCVVGLAGWRAGTDRSARTGWQPPGPLPAPVYVMPNTSGLNARYSMADLVEHLRVAAGTTPGDGPAGHDGLGGPLSGGRGPAPPAGGRCRRRA